MVASKLILASSTALFAVASASPVYNARAKAAAGKKYAARNDDKANISGEVLGGVTNDVTSAQQAITNLQMEFIANMEKPNSETIEKLVSGMDSEAENIMNSMKFILNSDNSAVSSVVSYTMLTTLFQQVISTMNVALQGMDSVPLNSPLKASLEEMSTTLDKMSNLAVDHKLSNNLIAEIGDIQKKILSSTDLSSKVRRQTSILDGIVTGVTSAKQNIDTLTGSLVSKGNDVSLESVNSFIVGLDSQIDGLIGSVGSALVPSNTQMSEESSIALLGPFFQSVGESSEVLLNYMAKGPLDPVLSRSVISLESTISNLANFADKYNMKAQQTMLININHRIHLLYIAGSTSSSHGSIAIPDTAKSTIKAASTHSSVPPTSSVSAATQTTTFLSAVPVAGTPTPTISVKSK